MKKQDLCKGNLFSGMLVYALPVMATGLLQVLYNAADTMVIGQFSGDESLAAVSATASLTALIVNLFLGLSNGIITVVGRYIGAKERDRVRDSVHTAMLLSVLCGVFLALLGLVASGPLLRLMGTGAEGSGVLIKATRYMRIYFIGAPAFLFYNFGAAVLRAAGDSKRPLIYLSTSGLVNVALNVLLVVVFHWDVAGVAVATVASQYLSAILIGRCLMKEDGDIRLRLSQLRILAARLREILRMGIPSGIQSSLFALSNVLIQSSINSFGELYMAGNGAAGQIENLIFTAMAAFHTTTLAYTSQNFGAKNTARVKRSFGCGLFQNTVFTGIIVALILLFNQPLLRLFTSSPVALDAGRVRLLVVGSAAVIGGAMDVASAHLRGMGMALIPMATTLAGVCGFRILWIYCFLPLFGGTWEMLFVCYPISYVLAFCTHLITIRVAYRKILRKIES